MVSPLRHGWFTTPTISVSNMAEARRITSRWPLVIGSNVPGQTAMRLSGGIVVDADQCVSVAAFKDERQFELERRPYIALDDHPGLRRKHRGERGGQPLAKAA